MKHYFMNSLSLLRTLEAVNQTGTVHDAADELRVSPSAVSQQLRRLSQGIGNPVTTRMGRRVVVTPVGREALRRTRPLIAQLEESLAGLGGADGPVAGTVRLAAFGTALRAGVPAMVNRLITEHEQLTVTLVQAEPTRAIAELERDSVDIAVVHHWQGRAHHDRAGLELRELYRDEADLICRRDDPLAGRGPVDVSDLGGRAWIATPAGSLCHDWLDTMLLDAVGTAEIVAEVEDFDVHLDWVAVGNGLGLVPRLGRRELPDGLVAVPLAKPPRRIVSLAVRAPMARHAPIVAVSDAIGELFATW